ncbi:MAG: LacI family DNA-binding transcriptional regulator [Chloroflexota bacterium]
MRVTLKDVAKQSGYSVTTVSRALNNYDDVNAETRAHIMSIADNLGYQPNLNARQLQGRKTNTIGLVMPPPSHTRDDDFFSLLIKGIIYEAAQHGYDVLTSADPQGKDGLETYQRLVGGQRVDGMIVARTYRKDARLAYLSDVDCPFIVHGRTAPDGVNHFHYIDVDSQHGIYLATQHLITQGHQHIGIILPMASLAFTPYRLNGYKQALSEAGMSFREDYVVHGKLTYESGRVGAGQLLDQHADMTAMVGCNDWMALGAMATVTARGYRVGEDFALTGYDDVPAARHADPPLTTVRSSIHDFGERLTRQLIRIIQERPTSFYQYLHQPDLIIRASSGAGG